MAMRVGSSQGLTEARAHIGAGDVATARVVLEDLIRRYGTGTGLYHDDSVSEYRHFANNFELALYAQLYRPTRQVRKLPQDRATLYSLYGAVLLELRDADGAEEALREALRVNPVSTYAMFELGEVMKLSGRKRECRELTLRAMEVAYTAAALGTRVPEPGLPRHRGRRLRPRRRLLLHEPRYRSRPCTGR